MATSQRTINQVRSILGRLDRSIDEARQRRLHGDEPATPPTTAQNAAETSPEPEAPDRPGDRPSNGVARSEPANRASATPPPPPVGPKRATPRTPSPFGRAKPLRKTGSEGDAAW